jgi:hypothetical protein
LSENSSSREISDCSIGQLPYILSQADAFNEVSDEKYLLWAFNQVVQVNNARMVELLEHDYFSLACFLFHRVLQFRLFVNFDSVLVLVSIVHAQTHLSIGALPDRLTNLVIVKGIFFGLGFWFAVEIDLLGRC